MNPHGPVSTDSWVWDLVDLFERRFSRRDLFRYSGAAGLAAFLAACGGGEEGPRVTPTPGGPATPTGEVRFLSAESFWADWDPYQTNALSQFRLNKQIYDMLMDFPTGDLSQPAPMLATEWTQIDDSTWEFKLREGVKFHNGKVFNSEDVKASLELASGATEKETVHAGSWVPTTVEIVDDLTVRLVTNVAFGPLFSSLFNTPIVSADDLAGDPEQLKGNPNGTGPFRLVNDEPNKKAMEANLDYWGGPPNIAELTWEFVQDPQTRLNALLAGQADAIDRVPPQHLQTIMDREGFTLTSVTGIENVNLWVRPGRFELWDTNRDFREAVMWSIDRKALADSLVLGQSRVATSFLPNNALFYEPQSPEYTFDQDRAGDLLATAGVPDGGPEFELWVAEGFLPRATEVVQSIVNSMQQVGLKPRVVTTDISGMIDDIFSEDGTGAMYHISWASSGDPNGALAQLLGRDGVWATPDETVFSLIEQGASETDTARRSGIYAELQQHLWQTVPHVPLYYSDFTIGHTDRLTDLRVLPNQFETYFYPARIAG
jgi:peptide/nickel transport system substrate-binding protein